MMNIVNSRISLCRKSAFMSALGIRGCRRGQSRQYELRCMVYQGLAGASEVWDSDWGLSQL